MRIGDPEISDRGNVTKEAGKKRGPKKFAVRSVKYVGPLFRGPAHEIVGPKISWSQLLGIL